MQKTWRWLSRAAMTPPTRMSTTLRHCFSVNSSLHSWQPSRRLLRMHGTRRTHRPGSFPLVHPSTRRGPRDGADATGDVPRGVQEPEAPLATLLGSIPIDPSLTTAAMVKRCRRMSSRKPFLHALEQQHVFQHFVYTTPSPAGRRRYRSPIASSRARRGWTPATVVEPALTQASLEAGGQDGWFMTRPTHMTHSWC